MKRTLSIIALAASVMWLVAPPAVASSSPMRLLSDRLVTVGAVRHSIETWDLSGHLIRTDASEATVAGGGIEQIVTVTRDGATFAHVRTLFTRQNGWHASPEATFADGKLHRLEPIAYQPLRALSVPKANAQLSGRALTTHPRMQLTSAGAPRRVAQFDKLLACGGVCDAVTGGLGPGARVVCLLACLLS